MGPQRVKWCRLPHAQQATVPHQECSRDTNFGWTRKCTVKVLKPMSVIPQGQHNPQTNGEKEPKRRLNLFFRGLVMMFVGVNTIVIYFPFPRLVWYPPKTPQTRYLVLGTRYSIPGTSTHIGFISPLLLSLPSFAIQSCHTTSPL